MRLIAVVISVVTLSAFTTLEIVDWKITDGYSIKFSGTDAEGVFKTFTGDIQFDENDLASSNCSLQIDVSSINTGNGMKNKHAISDKWFDAKQFPNIEFQSEAFAKSETGYSVTGKMKIHGVEKDITIPFTFENNVFRSSFSVNRLDYGVGTMKGSSKKVSNEIKLDISIPVTES